MQRCAYGTQSRVSVLADAIRSSSPRSRPDRRPAEKQRADRPGPQRSPPRGPLAEPDTRARSTARHLADCPARLYRRRDRVSRHERRAKADAARGPVDAAGDDRRAKIVVVCGVGRVAREGREAGRGRIGREGEADGGRRRAVDRVDVLEKRGTDLCVRDQISVSSNAYTKSSAPVTSTRAEQGKGRARADAPPS